MNWMLYGAYGYTGRLITDLADQRGMEPLLAGRSKKKLEKLASEYGFERSVISLDDPETLRRNVAKHDAVVHAAGPFSETSEAMVSACLDGGTHYIDITGEVPVLESIFRKSNEALDEEVALLPGMGFDVVPTDCLAYYVSSRVESPRRLSLFINPDVVPSKGTLITALNQISEGGKVRRNDTLASEPIGNETYSAPFPGGNETGVSVPLGDVVTARHSTGCPNIRTYVSLPVPFPEHTGSLTKIFSSLLKIPYTKSVLDRGINLLSGFSEVLPETSQQRENWIYARAEGREGNSEEAWLRTPETYYFTALCCLNGIEQLEEGQPLGVVTPSMAFGENFVLEVDGVHRYDSLTEC